MHNTACILSFNAWNQQFQQLSRLQWWCNLHNAQYCILTFSGTNNFFNNSASNAGGVIFTLHNTVLNFNGTNNFSNNSVNINGKGGAIYTAHNVVLTFSGTNNFKNSAGYCSDGGAIFALGSTLSFTGTIVVLIATLQVMHTDVVVVQSTQHTVPLLSMKSTNSSAVQQWCCNPHKNQCHAFNGTNNFFNNSAFSGGVFHASTNTLLSFIGTTQLNISVQQDTFRGVSTHVYIQHPKGVK